MRNGVEVLGDVGINSADPANDEFISYNDEQSCNDKVSYARAKGLGGVMVFELGGGWRYDATPHDGLLQAIKNAVAN